MKTSDFWFLFVAQVFTLVMLFIVRCQRDELKSELEARHRVQITGDHSIPYYPEKP